MRFFNLTIIALLVCTGPAFAQSKKEQNELLMAQLNVAKAQQSSLRTVWEIRANEAIALRNQVNKYGFPDVTKHYRACMDEVALLYGYVAKLKKLNETVSDSVDLCNKFVKGTYGRCNQMMESQRVTGYYPPIMNIIPDTLNLADKRRSLRNELLRKQIEVYRLAHERNLKHYGEMGEMIAIFTFLVDSLKKTDAALNAYLVGLKEYRTNTSDRVKVLHTDYFHHPKKYPAVYREVFGPAAGEAPEVLDRFERVKEYDHVVRNGGDFSPPPAAVPELPEPPRETIIVEIVEEPAEFPGGVAAMKEYIAKNLKYPETAKEMGISGKTYLKFVISEQGEISNIKVMRGVPDCPECDKEAIRLVKGMPKWKPAMNGGKAVNSYYNLPVTFKLQ